MKYSIKRVLDIHLNNHSLQGFTFIHGFMGICRTPSCYPHTPRLDIWGLGRDCYIHVYEIDAFARVCILATDSSYSSLHQLDFDRKNKQTNK